MERVNIEFRIENNNTEEVLKELQQKIKTALEDCGLTAERYATMGCPVDTGRLRASITHAVKGSQGGTHQYVDDNGNPFGYQYGAVGDENAMYLGTNVEYAPYVELGARGRSPRHFIKYAIENHKDEYKEILEQHLSGKK